MCDNQAFKPSARGNMNLPFFQNHLHCGIMYGETSLSPPSWTTPEDWAQSTQLHENNTSLPASPRDMPCLQQPYIVTEADQHELALALCVDECGECDDPTCTEPDCEADLIECTEASCSQPPIPGACHGNNTLCAGNLPPDVLDGAVSLAALRPSSSSYGHVYAPQPTDQYIPLCVAVAGGYYNPDHIHQHLPQCGPHNYPSGYHNQSMFSESHNMVPQTFGSTDQYSFGNTPQFCQYSGMYYDMGAQEICQIPFQQHLVMKEDCSRPTVSPGLRQSFLFSQDSTPSTTSPFSSPLPRGSVSTCDNEKIQSLSTVDSFPTLPTCRWEIGHNMICGRTFGDSALLQSHIQQVHTASLRKAHGFKCLWKGCPRRERGGEGFAQRSKLDRHIQSHTGCGFLNIPSEVSMLTAQQTKRQYALFAANSFQPLNPSFCTSVLTAARSLINAPFPAAIMLPLKQVN